MAGIGSWLCIMDITKLNSQDLILGNWIGSSSSRFFRNYKNLFENYFYEFPYSDWPLNFELSFQGKIGYLDIPTYVYREHNNSLSKLNDTKFRLEFYQNILKHQYQKNKFYPN